MPRRSNSASFAPRSVRTGLSAAVMSADTRANAQPGESRAADRSSQIRTSGLSPVEAETATGSDSSKPSALPKGTPKRWTALPTSHSTPTARSCSDRKLSGQSVRDAIRRSSSGLTWMASPSLAASTMSAAQSPCAATSCRSASGSYATSRSPRQAASNRCAVARETPENGLSIKSVSMRPERIASSSWIKRARERNARPNEVSLKGRLPRTATVASAPARRSATSSNMRRGCAQEITTAKPCAPPLATSLHAAFPSARNARTASSTTSAKSEGAA